MEQKRRDKKRPLYIGIAVALLAALILIMIIKGSTPEDKRQVYSFAEGLKEIEEIDKKYDTSFRTERLNKTVASRENIPLMLEDIKKFEAGIRPVNDDDTRALLLLIDARKLMLVAQWYWQYADEIGDVGLVIDQNGFNCAEAEYVADATYYFNETMGYGLRAVKELDMLLGNYRHVDGMLEGVGVDANKPEFYRSHFDYIGGMVQNNIFYLKKLCGIQIRLEDTSASLDQNKVKTIESLYLPQEK